MFRKQFLPLLLALCCILGTAAPALAAEVECDTVYCFTQEDFSGQEDFLGICVTHLPDSDLGTVMLGTRVIRPGDILTADQLAQMTFSPLRSQEDRSAAVTYLPIYENRVDPSATMTIAIRGKEDKSPAAEDSALETYKNIPYEGTLKVKDPEGQALTFSVTRQPKRGQVTVREDGSFTYTPKKNKVGVDSFTYTAADPAGNVSREATVTITILRPTDATQYTDTMGKECRFAAEWMKNTGIFVGEKVVGNPCFNPEKQVTRGEFVTMLVKALDIPTQEDAAFTGYTDEIPGWLQPYLAAALRSGLTNGLPSEETFGADTPITGAEAAVMLQNALDLTENTPEEAHQTDSGETATVPVWAESALLAMESHNISINGEAPLTRGQAAVLLYQAVQMAEEAPGMAILRAQQ